jgi:hypothetical protein
MRCPPYQKTSPRTLALPGFVVSGVSKMRGSMGSVVSFERVQMRPYEHSSLLPPQARSFEANHSKAGDAQCRKTFSRAEDPKPDPASALHLNSFKWIALGRMLPLRIAVAQLMSMRVALPAFDDPSRFPHDHSPSALSRKRCGVASCRSLERACLRQLCRLTITSPDWPHPEPARAPEPVHDLWNIDLANAVEAPSSTWCALTCSSFAPRSAVAVRRRVRNSVDDYEAPQADPPQAAATSCLTSSLCTAADCDTFSDSFEAPPLQQFVLRRAGRATETLGRNTRVAPDIDWSRRSDLSLRPLSLRPLSDAGRSIPGAALYGRSSERLPRQHCARTKGHTWVIWQGKAMASTVPPASGEELPRQQLTRQRLGVGHKANAFERVQMSSRSRPIYPVGRPVAPAETSGHLVTGGTPMHRLK